MSCYENTFSIVITVIIVLIIFIVFNPSPASLLVRKAFESGLAVKTANYEGIAVNGYHIVNANDALAPGAKYPTPLLQLDDVYQFVVEHVKVYDFDIERLFLAGDSADAQIVS